MLPLMKICFFTELLESICVFSIYQYPYYYMLIAITIYLIITYINFKAY